jgi:hypothetical protein
MARHPSNPWLIKEFGISYLLAADEAQTYISLIWGDLLRAGDARTFGLSFSST